MGSPIKSILAIALIALCLAACSSCGSGSAIGTQKQAGRLSEDERHRLYSAALATSESPLDTELFKNVCRKIGIFDADSNPNGEYPSFVAAHVQWGLRLKTEQFRQEISSREKAEKYVRAHLPD